MVITNLDFFLVFHFEIGRKVVMQTRNFFVDLQPEKNPSLQNHFSANLKITSKGAD